MVKVSYEVHINTWKFSHELKKLERYKLLSFDTETRSIFSSEEREISKKLLLSGELKRRSEKHEASVITNSSGLSFPSIIHVTHFVFGIDIDKSIIFVTKNIQDELIIWRWLAQATNLFVVHNALFDFKIMYQRIGKLPSNYVDTMLLAKTYLNHVDTWKADVGLKTLMQSYYDPSWSLMDDYEPEDLLDKKFLKYAAIDGAATYYLYQQIMESDCE